MKNYHFNFKIKHVFKDSHSFNYFLFNSIQNTNSLIIVLP